ncbi:MAG: translocation/assembly module TamB domain-containing protein, partial [Prevotella sp.]|nr:translocation/assembly module TamB domain-containing protein [Prevotella sp.]
MKYSLPVIPLKTFTIEDGSYLEWTGEMMNPRLHITAKETVKANVSIDGVSHMVTFLTGVRLSKTLNDMGLEFIIEAPENQTIADELSMKSAEERGKLAVTMLTTGMYLSDGNTSKFSMNSALNSFLQSEINNIAGNALKTIDLSFGMESSTEQDGTMHNDYTFKFAKRFWNNRLSIAVGGKVSSGPDVSGQNKSFFNNVDLQYRLSDTSNQYLQMFYKRSVYDYLEGYLSQYGAGYMWKKKSQTLKGIFKKEPKMEFRRMNPKSLQGGELRKSATPRDTLNISK